MSGPDLPPGFPKGLRVLVADDDQLCLKVVHQMLLKCDYKGMIWLWAPCLVQGRMNFWALILNLPSWLKIPWFQLLKQSMSNVYPTSFRPTVTTCPNGSSALALLRANPTDFDLVLSDVYMPGVCMDCIGALQGHGLPRRTGSGQVQWWCHTPAGLHVATLFCQTT